PATTTAYTLSLHDALPISRLTVETLYALSVTRTREWHGVSRSDRWAMLGGQLVVATERRRPPFWVWNAALRQLYMSSYHLAPDLDRKSTRLNSSHVSISYA